MRAHPHPTAAATPVSRRFLVRWAAGGFAGLAALAVLTACGGSAAAGGAPAAVTVQMNDQNRYVPASITVAKGTTVTWQNVGSVAHTVTDDPSKAVNPADAVLPSGAQPFDSGLINGGQSWSYTFTVPGAYTYFCIPHELLGMVGKITVTG
jgi:plastocyanin